MILCYFVAYVITYYFPDRAALSEFNSSTDVKYDINQGIDGNYTFYITTK